MSWTARFMSWPVNGAHFFRFSPKRKFIVTPIPSPLFWFYNFFLRYSVVFFFFIVISFSTKSESLVFILYFGKAFSAMEFVSTCCVRLKNLVFNLLHVNLLLTKIVKIRLYLTRWKHGIMKNHFPIVPCSFWKKKERKFLTNVPIHFCRALSTENENGFQGSWFYMLPLIYFFEILIFSGLVIPYKKILKLNSFPRGTLKIIILQSYITDFIEVHILPQ